METNCKYLVYLMTVLGGLTVCGETNTPAGGDGYDIIVERNSFGLKATVSEPSVSPSIGAPKEDLFLTGITEFSTNRFAFFKLTEPGRPDACFVLGEGEQNEWLEVREIDFVDATVKVVLKRPLMRARTVGVEMVFSFQAQGVDFSEIVAPVPSSQIRIIKVKEYSSDEMDANQPAPGGRHYARSPGEAMYGSQDSEEQ